MKLKSVKEVKAFIDVVDSCTDDVFLKSPYGDVFNMKSKLSQYIAIGKLLETEGDTLELFCMNRSDEAKFFEFFGSNPDVIGK